MRNKQLCALLLAMSLVVGIMPFSGFAMDEAEDSISIEVEENGPSEDLIAVSTDTSAEQESVEEEPTAETETEGEADLTEELEAIPDDAESQDPERYQALRRQAEGAETSAAPVAEEDMGITLLSGTKTRTSFLTGKKYSVPSSGTIADGIDVSKWDDEIDWKKVKKAGVDFAIIRVGYRGYGNGTLYTDEFFKSNIKNALSAGVKVGVYIYSQAISGKEAREEAKYCINRIKDYDVTLPVVMDVEYAEANGGYTGRMYNANLSRTKLTNMCLAFVDECKDAGYEGMIYANRTMLENKVYASKISAEAKVWLANYTTNTSYSGEYDYWQYSETGSVNGIDYPVDCNFGFNLPVPATSVSLNKSTLSMACKNTATLKKTVKPSNSTSKVTWSSSRKSVATVSSSGKVTAKDVGTTTITVKAGSKKATCKVTVRPRMTAIQSIERVSSSKIKLTWNKKSEADEYRVYRSTSKNGTYEFVGKSSGSSYTDTGLKANTTYYYYLRAAGYQGDTRILSNKSSVKSAKTTVYTSKVTLNSNSLKLTRTAKRQLVAELKPSNTQQGLTWKSSNTAAATVSDSGLVRGVDIGATTITATSGQASATCRVTIIPGRVKLISVEKKSSGTLRLDWNAISSAEYYRIYRSTSQNGTYDYIAHTSKLHYTDSTCKSGTRYYYKIRSCVKKDGTKYKGASSNRMSAVA